MPAIDFVELRRQLRLDQVLELLRCEVVWPCGGQVRGPCPVHGSTRPRSRVFRAHLERHCWHCFRCGARGNALELWLEVTKQPVYAGALDLCQRLNLEVPWLARARGPRRRQVIAVSDYHSIRGQTRETGILAEHYPRSGGRNWFSQSPHEHAGLAVSPRRGTPFTGKRGAIQGRAD